MDGWKEGVPEPKSNPGEGPVAETLELPPGDDKVACCGVTECTCVLVWEKKV